VLLVTIDTVRADRVGAYGYTKGSTPALDRLAREGVRFGDATTQAPLTGPAHAALLTGVYPARFGIRDNASTPLPDAATTIAERFRAAGYRTGAFIGAFILDRPYGFAQGFDEFDARFERFSSADKLRARRPGGAVADAALKWLGAKDSRPFFAWVHLYDAHAPYEAPPPFGTRFRAAPYDGAIAYVDAQVGRLIAALEQSGALDRTLVSVAADHGEGLGEHGEDEHGFFLYESTLHVPWILRLPNHQHAGAVVADQVRAIDVAPTLLALAGLPRTDGLDGENVAPLLQARRSGDAPPSYAETYYASLHFGWSPLSSLRDGTWKYVDAPTPELYDVKSDPAERRNLSGSRETLAAGMAREARRIESAFGAPEAPVPAVDAETRARLRSLGYVGGTAAQSGHRGPDPKDMIAGLAAYRATMTRVTAALRTGKPAAAIPLLEELLASHGESYELHLFLGDAYAQTKRTDEALVEYAAARLANPATAEPLIASARARLAAGDAAAAVADLAQAERLEPHSDEALTVRGAARAQQGDAKGALDDFRAAVALNGSNAEARVKLAGLAMDLAMYDQARGQFEALLAMNYRPSRMHFGLGQVAQAHGDAAKAAAEYRAALRLEPSFAEAQQALRQLGSR
jgi:choline-sulfatase